MLSCQDASCLVLLGVLWGLISRCCICSCQDVAYVHVITTKVSPKPLWMLQVVMETNLGVQDEAPLQDAQLQRLAEREPQYWGHQLSAAMAPPKSVAAGPVRDLRFLDTQTCFWQLAQGQSLQHGATTSQGIPHLGELDMP